MFHCKDSLHNIQLTVSGETRSGNIHKKVGQTRKVQFANGHRRSWRPFIRAHEAEPNFPPDFGENFNDNSHNLQNTASASPTNDRTIDLSLQDENNHDVSSIIEKIYKLSGNKRNYAVVKLRKNQEYFICKSESVYFRFGSASLTNIDILSLQTQKFITPKVDIYMCLQSQTKEWANISFLPCYFTSFISNYDVKFKFDKFLEHCKKIGKPGPLKLALLNWTTAKAVKEHPEQSHNYNCGSYIMSDNK